MKEIAALIFFWLVGAILILFARRFSPRWRKVMALVAVLSGMVFWYTLADSTRFYWLSDALRTDGYSFLLLTVILLMAAIVLISSLATENDSEKEGLLLLSLAGAGFCVLANDLVFLLAAIVLAQLPLFVLVLNRGETGREAALKAILVFSLILSICGLGAALVYYSSGTTCYSTLVEFLKGRRSEELLLLTVGIMLWQVGMVALLGVFPVHMWLMDLADCQELSLLAFYGSGLLTAQLGALGRFFLTVLAEPEAPWITAMETLGMLSLWAGVLSASVQRNPRRFVVTLATALVGLILLSLTAAAREAESGMAETSLVLILTLAFGWLGLVFALADEGRQLGKRSWWVPGLFLMWTAGLPPFPGFWARLELLKNLLARHSTTTALLTGLATSLMLAVCFWFWRTECYRSGAELPGRPRRSLGEILISCLMIGMTLVPTGWMELVRQACTFLR